MDTENDRRPASGWRTLSPTAVIGFLLVVGAIGFLGADEMKSSRIQARHFSELARDLTYRMDAGPSDAIRFPAGGPFDERLGYSRIPGIEQRLGARDYAVQAQARLSPALLDLSDQGYFPPYREKTQAGLELLDCRGEPLFVARHPERIYQRFEAAPPLVVDTLLFIENRELLDTQNPTRNPAVEWTRLGKAMMSQAVKLVDPKYDVPGGSTLATQIEKFRHSPEGITATPAEKLRQMVSASLRAYRDGEETLSARRQIVLDYLNTVPLSALAGYGEVNGLGDGLWVWFGADFDQVNRLLRLKEAKGEELAAQGLAFRQVLSLMIAHRRPSYYLTSGREQLGTLTDRHLRLLASAGLISAELRDAALAAQLHFRDSQTASALAAADANKTASVMRGRLSGMLDLPLYELDRLDLTGRTTLDRDMQDTVTVSLHQLNDPKYAKAAGLVGEHLLSEGDPSKVSYSLTLVERGGDANRVRVQTDNLDQPLDINEGTKLELGSTAKLRTLASYLDIVAQLHKQYGAASAAELRKLQVDRRDNLSRWAVDYLIGAKDRGLAAMLEAAMQRRYSASPGESFFTGGGVHTFENFKREDDYKRPTVYEALRDSVNLAFIRMMRDIVRFHMYQQGSTARVLDDPELRAAYLARFADREGRVFVKRFYRRYHGKSADEAMETLLGGIRLTAERLAVVYRSLEPQEPFKDFAAFVTENLSERPGTPEPGESRLRELYERHSPGHFSLGDRGYIARIHPLELWVVGYLRKHPDATLTQVQEASAAERQDVYSWLFKTRHRGAQDLRIQTLLEIEAFGELHRQWKKLGYPFEHLVPSYATAIGSSGDRPAALAELMGIIVNDGMRLPMVRIDELHFAAGTPYETVFQRASEPGERVMEPEVAATLRRALREVVDAGTARRVHGAFDLLDGTKVEVGGKTGTGDNRLEAYGPKGRLVGSRAVNRTATFVFYIGDRYFGTLTAFVTGAEADKYSFTSALPAQILKALAPQLAGFLDRHRSARCSPPATSILAQVPRQTEGSPR